MQATITNWGSASAVWQDFTHAHPELGYSGNANSWIHFQRRHGKRLKELDVIRQTGARRAMIADVDRFERVVFDMLTHGEPSDEHSTAVAA
jgi:hypothetical protein